MRSYIKERTMEEADYICKTGQTIRNTAGVFNICKSTVHNDLSKRLKEFDGAMYERVKIVLDKNFEEKHIRGGESTKKKYSQEREK